MPLADIYHQTSAHQFVQRALSQQRLAHAYIFHGPDGVGKEMFARALSQLLLCENPQSISPDESSAIPSSNIRQGCGKCQECVSVSNHTHPDIHLIYRQLIHQHPDSTLRKRKALDLSVDVVRHFIVDKAAFTPLRGKLKVFIIREADRITIAAQNALLKTLEEPPGETLIILLATDLTRLLPTTLSRCQVIGFNPLPDLFVCQMLSQTHPQLSTAHANWYAHISGGSIGYAALACDNNQFDMNNQLIEQLVALNSHSSGHIGRAWIEESKKSVSRFKERDPDISDSEASRRSLLLFIKLTATWYNDIIHLLADNELGITNTHKRPELKQASQRMQIDHAIDAIRRCNLAEFHLQRNANTQLTIETLVNDIARLNAGKQAISAA